MIDFNKDIYLDTFKEEMLKLRQELADMKILLMIIANRSGVDIVYKDTIEFAASRIEDMIKVFKRPTLSWDE